MRYEVIKKSEVIEENPSLLPPTVEIDQVREPILSVQIRSQRFYWCSDEDLQRSNGLYLNTEYL